MDKASLVKKSSLLAFNVFDNLENLIETKSDLSKLPVQPLYLALKKMGPESVSLYLSKMSKAQRVAFLDLDLWVRDELDFNSFGYWINAYSNCPDEDIKFEFSSGPHFGLFLKSKFNIWTFDAEDPRYPDHDNYFLTEDNLLLFEFDINFPHLEEVRFFIRNLYSNLGVEKAYAHLFKIVSEIHSNLNEEEFHFKKERLRDLGFLDYYEALAVEAPFQSLALVDSFIEKKKGITGEIGMISKIQTLPKNALVSFGDSSSDILAELEKINDEKRRDFLRFNFIRLINSINTLNDTLKADSVSMAISGKRTRSIMELGFDYLRQKRSEKSLFDIFGFEDLYKIGLSLIRINQKKIKDGLKKSNFEDSEPFLGRHFLSLLENSFDDNLKFNGDIIHALDTYDKWVKESNIFLALLPFISKFHSVHQAMIASGSIQDTYYLNYTKEEMDFEVLLISCFANFTLGYFEDSKNRKLGVSIPDAKRFFNAVTASVGINKKLEEFINSFGMGEISGISMYLDKILKEHLEGVDLNALDPNDFKHVGGPVILNLQ